MELGTSTYIHARSPCFVDEALLLCLQGIALLVLGAGAGLAQLQAFMGSAWRVLGELTYPKPSAITRLTVAVLLSSAALTLIVWGLDTGFAKLLLPPFARKLSGMS